MNRMSNHRVASTAVLALLAVLAAGVGTALADTPNPTSAVIKTRIFNDCPLSTVTTYNAYPATIAIEDSMLGCSGFANLHNWSFSTDGVNPVQFQNYSSFSISMDLQITGTTDGEGGLRISPWWSPDVDGRFNCRTTDGEIACFGGRLPFYSFTAAHGLHYVKGTTIRLQVIYKPNGLIGFAPGTIEYKVEYPIGTPYTSGPIAFDSGNPSEKEPHGQWGILTPTYVGGYVQCFLVSGNFSSEVRAIWSNVTFTGLPVVPAIAPVGLAALGALLGAAGLVVMMRRRREAGGTV
jgi:hypothetical protein